MYLRGYLVLPSVTSLICRLLEAPNQCQSGINTIHKQNERICQGGVNEEPNTNRFIDSRSCSPDLADGDRIEERGRSDWSFNRSRLLLVLEAVDLVAGSTVSARHAAKTDPRRRRRRRRRGLHTHLTGSASCSTRGYIFSSFSCIGIV